VRSFLYGALEVASEPAGAEVLELPGRRLLGRTPLRIDRLVPGRQSFEIRLEGHEKQEATIAVKAEQTGRLDVALRPSKGVIFGREWRNSLAMKLVPVGELMVAATETRVSDWQAYRAATGAVAASTNFRQRPDEPVAGVSRDDANAFCDWLTKTERGQGFIQDNHRYRLPTDAEWSAFAGLTEEPGRSPHELDGLNRVLFPWGTEWPPPPNSGNFADETARPRLPRGTPVIPGYRDGFINTSPVATFTPNHLNLHDLGGNVWEWVADDYGGDPANPASNWAVCRGGSWADGARDDLLVSMRNILKADYRGDGLYGFRIVLQREGGMEIPPELFPLVPALPAPPSP
jgi:formylglycine-generating enzyme required for sulfatase activity